MWYNNNVLIFNERFGMSTSQELRFNIERCIYIAGIMFLLGRWGMREAPEQTFLIWATFAMSVTYVCLAVGYTCSLLRKNGFFR